MTAVSIAGKLSFNPLKDSLINESGDSVMLDPPFGKQFPDNNFIVDESGYQPPIENGSDIMINIKSDSERLQSLKPFSPWNGEDYQGLKLLIKAKLKCTTDHISMAGPWLRYRGHLDNISNNLLIGATNAFLDKVNHTKNH